jgi:hypothetical protein
MSRTLTFFFLVVAAGCGSSTPAPPSFGGEEGKAIATLVADFNEGKHDAVKLKKLFVGGTLPTDWKQYDKYDFQLDGNPTVDGATATATLKKRDHSNAEAGTTTFTFAKDGSTWKIKSAPVK